jgi:hypothetical protein
MSTLKERIAGRVKFVRYQDGELWYACEDGFEFAIPKEDLAGAVFLAEDKGMLFMRWIRKHMEMIAKAKA